MYGWSLFILCLSMCALAQAASEYDPSSLVAMVGKKLGQLVMLDTEDSELLEDKSNHFQNVIARPHAPMAHVPPVMRTISSETLDDIWTTAATCALTEVGYEVGTLPDTVFNQAKYVANKHCASFSTFNGRLTAQNIRDAAIKAARAALCHLQYDHTNFIKKSTIVNAAGFALARHNIK